MYRVIEAQKAAFTIVRMTGLLEVSRSGFYKWRAAQAAGPTPAQQRRAAIDAKVQGFHHASDQVYGAPRILADLREDGEVISRKTVAASMRRQRLAGISPRRFTPVTTVVDLDAHRPIDLVDRRFDRGELDKVWTSDITYLSTAQGWLYLCAVRDGCSRRVLGWAVEDHMRTDLVESALSMAVTMRGHLIHLRAARPVRPSPRHRSISRPNGGVLGQRSGRILLEHTEIGVLPPIHLADEDRC
jgi:putative transposase